MRSRDPLKKGAFVRAVDRMGVKRGSPEMRLYQIRNGVGPGPGGRPMGDKTPPIFQAVFERKILELKKNVVRILNFD